MILGFTGTRKGMIQPQRVEFISQLYVLTPFSEFHHGDCVGADAQAHQEIKTYFPSTFLHVHPPIIDKNRAHCIGHVNYEPKGYLERNEDIVNATSILIATPKEMTENTRSGTWHAIRYAIRTMKRVIIIRPNGTVYHE
jgi:hypothetical protein